MKLIAISGSCRLWNDEVDRDVRDTIRKIIEEGNSVVGGATGVDYIATDEIIKLDRLDRIQINIPTKLDYYLDHYKNGGEVWDGISLEEGLKLVKQLEYINSIRKIVIKEFGSNREVKQDDYDYRDSMTVKFADELFAFRVNNSYGTTNTINMAKLKGLKIVVKDYEIKI